MLSADQMAMNLYANECITKPTPLCRYQPWPCSSMTWVVEYHSKMDVRNYIHCQV
jgi:hypothetical protein